MVKLSAPELCSANWASALSSVLAALEATADSALVASRELPLFRTELKAAPCSTTNPPAIAIDERAAAAEAASESSDVKVFPPKEA